MDIFFSPSFPSLNTQCVNERTLSVTSTSCQSFVNNNVSVFECFKGELITRCHQLFSSLRTLKEARSDDPAVPLVGVLAAAVGAVAALGHVEEGVHVGIQLGHPVARHQERRQVEQIHKHFVAIAGGKKRFLF